MAKDRKDNTTMTPVFRMAFPSLFRTEEYQGRETYGIEAIFPKGTDLTKDHGKDKKGKPYIALKKLAKRVAHDKWGDKLPKNLKSPFINGNEYNETHDNQRPEIEDCEFVRLRTTAKPDVVDITRRAVIDETEIYSGRLARASVYCHAYDTSGSRGITFLLNNVQIFEDDGVQWGASKRSGHDDFDDDVSQESEAQGEFGDGESNDDMWRI